VEQLEDRTLLSGTPLLLADINPVGASAPANFARIGTETYFTANDGTHGNELWKSDGTTAGTVMVADINPGGAGSYPANLTNFNGKLYFAANDGTHGYELWASDGTAAGTVMVADINTTFQSTPSDLTNVNGTLFFADGGSLWKSDGTAAGTVQVSTAVDNPRYLTNVNGELFFSGQDGNGQELWKSDGTATGTTLVKDIYPGTYVGYFGGIFSYNSFPHDLTNVNGTLCFAATDANGTELWKSDGTATGTVSLTGSVNPSALTNVNGTLFFGEAGTNGGLYRSDGTATGTVRLAPAFVESPITDINGELYFAGNGGVDGTELWKSDGTTAGTTMVKDINPGTTTTWYYTGTYGTFTRSTTTTGSYPNDLTNVNGALYFSANDGTDGVELWKSDGTAAGTTQVQDIMPGSHYASYTTNYYYGGSETRSATLPNSSYPSNLTNLNGTLLFSADDGTHGSELWAVPAGPSLAVTATSTTPTAGQADSFTITALNADGTPDTALSGAVTVTSSDPKAVLPASVTLTNGTGQFSATFETAGPQSVTATDVQTPSDQGSASNLVVQAAAASSLTLTGFPSPVIVGVPGNFTVTAYDTFGNVATTYGGTVAFTSNDPAAALPANATLTNGVGHFSATLMTLGTNLSLTATDTNNGGLTATQAGIEAIPFVSLSGPSAGALGQTLTYSIGAGADPAGTVFTVTWGDGTSAQTTATTVTHTYTNNTIYNVSVTAAAAGLSSNPASQSVNVQPVSVTVAADPAKAGAEMLVVASTAIYERLALSGNGSGVSLTFDGYALPSIAPTNGETFALVEVFAGGTGFNTVNASGLSVSSVLVGGPGNDTLYGGSGRNLLIGGPGSDTLYAGSAGDILIGSTTSYDSNTAADQTALAFIMLEWDSADSYSTRVSKLMKGGGLNGKYVLNSTTVLDDNATDRLYGYAPAVGAALDWFFAHHSRTNGDQVYNLVSGEVVTGV
jgi:ELWxxDGT repeat protein